MEKEKEEYVWKRKIYYFIYVFVDEKEKGEGKLGKYLEKENVLFAEKKEKGEGKERKYQENENVTNDTKLDCKQIKKKRGITFCYLVAFTFSLFV